MSEALQIARSVYRFHRTLVEEEGRITPRDAHGNEYCINCDCGLSAETETKQEIEDRNARELGYRPDSTVALCNVCYEQLLEWNRSRQ